MRSRVKTTGIVETHFEFKDLHFKYGSKMLVDDRIVIYIYVFVIMHLHTPIHFGLLFVNHYMHVVLYVNP